MRHDLSLSLGILDLILVWDSVPNVELTKPRAQ